MNNNLINRIRNSNLQNLYYNKACLKVTEDNDYTEVYKLLLQFVKETVKEVGCVEFFAAPSNIEAKEIMLWEVWKDKTALKKHMNETYTKDILGKNLIEVKWSNSASFEIK